MKYASRKYVDLISRSSSKHANLEPFATKVEVGDYGEIDHETGDFVYKGNIYRNENILKIFPDLQTEACEPQTSECIDRWIITANTTHQRDIDLSATANVSQFAGATMQVQFAFTKERGAFLAMYRPRMKYLPKTILPDKLCDIPELKRLVLVSGVVYCPAYALSMSEGNTDTIRLAFMGDVPVPPGSGVVGVSTSTKGHWICDNKSSFYQDGCNPSGECTYIPLITVKQITDPRRFWSGFRDDPETGDPADDMWLTSRLPWSSLDDDGIEDEFVDEVME